MSDSVLLKRDRDILTIVLNRPEKRNALSPEMVNELHRQIDRVSRDSEIRAVILTGAGKAFCAGADLAYLKQLSTFSEAENLQDSKNLAELFNKIYHLQKLTVAMVTGAALAGGCGLALCCDYIFAASETAKFGFTEVRIGFVPAIVMNFLIRKIAPGTALHLALSGKIFSAEEAKKLGLVEQVFPLNGLRDRTMDFIGTILQQNSFQAMMTTKTLLQDLLEHPLNRGLEIASAVNAKSRQTHDCQQGLKAFLNKEKIEWRKF
ncbi:hypothetical protein B1H10_05940 [candidate division KSB1 bacterium 4484_188]|nr:MAG: hypothetical protein B1H10_05940 [candidate division KSB1 bacterium 4484_188]